MIKEQAYVVSVDDEFVQIETRLEGGCGSCQSSGVCGTGIVASLFGKQPRLLRLRNTIGAKAGDTVTVGLNRFALVTASLMIYLLPLIMLVLGAIVGEWLAEVIAPESIELFSITGGLVFAVSAFIFNRRILNGSAMIRLFQPVLLQHG